MNRTIRDILGTASPLIKWLQWKVSGTLKFVLLQFTIATGLMLLTGCEKQPDYVYVAGPGFREMLKVSSAHADRRNLEVGEWLELKAIRRTGPWVRRKKSADLGPGCWWLRPPPEFEENAQGNVTWHAEPKDPAVFNIPTPVNLHERKVRFTEPGHYKLWATSKWCGESYSSNVIEVSVRR